MESGRWLSILSVRGPTGEARHALDRHPGQAPPRGSSRAARGAAPLARHDETDAGTGAAGVPRPSFFSDSSLLTLPLAGA
jgi:hypothetical protein